MDFLGHPAVPTEECPPSFACVSPRALAVRPTLQVCVLAPTGLLAPRAHAQAPTVTPGPARAPSLPPPPPASLHLSFSRVRPGIVEYTQPAHPSSSSQHTHRAGWVTFCICGFPSRSLSFFSFPTRGLGAHSEAWPGWEEVVCSVIFRLAETSIQALFQLDPRARPHPLLTRGRWPPPGRRLHFRPSRGPHMCERVVDVRERSPSPATFKGGSLSSSGLPSLGLFSPFCPEDLGTFFKPSSLPD